MRFYNLKLLTSYLFAAILFGWTSFAQDDSNSATTHYVLPDFVKGTVLMRDGHIENVTMNYNMVTEEMIFEKGNTRLAMKNTESIDTVYLGSRKFVPYEKVFYEVLINNRISLVVRHKRNLLPAGKPAGYGTTSETGATTSLSMLVESGSLYKLKLPDDYHVTDASQFILTRDNVSYRIGSERQFLKIFPEISKEIKLFINQYKLDIRKLKDLTILVNRCNELLQ